MHPSCYAAFIRMFDDIEETIEPDQQSSVPASA